MNEKDLNSLKESVDTLIDENERLRKRIEVLEAEKNKSDDEEISNFSQEDDKSILNELLKERRYSDYNTYLTKLRWKEIHGKKSADNRSEECEPDLTYDPERDGMDWSYRPRRGTAWPKYWPYEVGDWPPGPQIGDVPPGTIPPGFPYWSIVPPYWPYPYYWPYHNDVSTTGGNPNNYTYTFSNKTEE